MDEGRIRRAASKLSLWPGLTLDDQDAIICWVLSLIDEDHEDLRIWLMDQRQFVQKNYKTVYTNIIKHMSNMPAHFIRPNRTGFFITGIDDQPVFKTVEEALKWANEKGIVITRER